MIFSESVHRRIQAAKTLNLETGCHEIVGYIGDTYPNIHPAGHEELVGTTLTSEVFIR